MTENPTHKDKLKWYFLGLLLLVNTILWYIALTEGKSHLTFQMLNVGQGDSILIESPTGVQVLIDAGPGRGVLREISSVLPFYDRHIDMIVLTHPDKDHYEGFVSILKKYKTSVLLEPGTDNPSSGYSYFENLVKEKNIPAVLARSGQVVDLGGGAYLQILFPDRDVSGLEINDSSIVMKLVFGETSILLTGDSPEKIESYLLSIEKNLLDSDILKVGHHGSKTSSSLAFVSAVSPDFALISSGKENSYGHPHKEVLDVFEDLNVPAYDTCDNGKITLISDGKNFSFKNKNLKEVKVGCK